MVRFLVMSSPGGLEQNRLLTMLRAPAVCIEERDWDCAAGGTGTFALVLLVVEEKDSARLTDFFDQHPSRRLSSPYLAVLPQNASHELLAAAQAADDFILAPLRREELGWRVARLIGGASEPIEDVKQRLGEEMRLRSFITADEQMLRVLDDVRRMARANAPVLITGETGTGKELCARAVHHLSPRKGGPFIPVDCPALPEHLLENELFGHVRGAYTDAHGDQKGLVALARGGTLFLDEVDSLSDVSQAKLLRFLQDRLYRPLGSDRFVAADVTVIAAANRDLRECVEARRFRGDLYYRLNVLQVTLPPLRERPADIELISRHYLRQFTPPGDRPPVLTAAVVKLLVSYAWPGNVRELVNTIQRASVLAAGGSLLPRHVSFGAQPAGLVDAPVRFREERTRVIEAFERKYVSDLLERHHGNVTHAAKAAGKERRAFGRIIRKYDLARATALPPRRPPRVE